MVVLHNPVIAEHTVNAKINFILIVLSFLIDKLPSIFFSNTASTFPTRIRNCF